MDQLNLEHVPPQPGPRMPIIRIKAGERIGVVILSPSIWGLWTHWAGNHSLPCFAEKSQCEGCKRGLPRRWKGYVHVVVENERRQGFLELTPLSAESLLMQSEKGRPLRGYRFEIKRLAGDKARMHVRSTHPDPSPFGLPHHQDPQSTLMRLWGWEHRTHTRTDDVDVQADVWEGGAA